MNQSSITNILLAILGVAVAVLFFLHFKSTSGPKINLSPSSKDIASVSATGSRIAFVNIDSFFEKYKGYKAVKAEVEAGQKNAQKNLESKMAALQGDYAKLMQQAQSGQITPQQAQAKEKEIMARSNSLKSEEQSMAKGLADKTEKATKDLYKKMEEYFESNKEKYNCDFVMGYQTNGVLLYFDKKMDITNQVIEDLNK